MHGEHWDYVEFFFGIVLKINLEPRMAIEKGLAILNILMHVLTFIW
jgi:hypothetical protein